MTYKLTTAVQKVNKRMTFLRKDLVHQLTAACTCEENMFPV